MDFLIHPAKLLKRVGEPPKRLGFFSAVIFGFPRAVAFRRLLLSDS